MRWTPLLGLLLLGCDSTELPSQYAPYTHVPGNNQTDAKYEGSRRDWFGDVSVEEGTVDGAFSVELDVGGERVNFEIRSAFGSYDGPAASTDPTKKGTETGTKKEKGGGGTTPISAENPNGLDLIGLLHEREGVQVLLEEDGVTGDISLLFRDENRVPYYLTESAGVSDLSNAINANGNFVQRGESLGTAPAGDTEITLYTVRVATDDGLVDAYPGFPVDITVLNQRFQFLLLANWERTFNQNQSCPIDERLAYEMVRIDDARGFDRDKAAEGIERPESDSIDGGGCVVTGGI